MLRVVGGWCVFFNNGCVLHQVGDAEGDKFRYKPSLCALFPIQQDRHDNWYIRQKGFKRESWDLFCLDPANCTTPAAESLRDEIALAKRFDDEAKAKALSCHPERSEGSPEILRCAQDDNKEQSNDTFA
jgi:hypothetical protein